MRFSFTSLVPIYLILLCTSAFAWNQEMRGSGEIREILLSGTTGDITLSVSYNSSANYLDGGIVDIAINNTRGETLYFHTERTYYSCKVSYENFIVDNVSGTIILVTINHGGNFDPYESWVIFLDHSDLSVSHSLTPTDSRNMGGSGSYYPALLDVDGDGIFDHLSYPNYLFYLPNECQALKRQLWIEFCRVPMLTTSGQITIDDNTLAVLVDPASQAFRDMWVESMSTWLHESVELSQSNPSILEVRGKVWAFKEALTSGNFELVSDLYSDL